MTLTRFTPFNDVAVLQNRLNSIFHDFTRTGSADSENLAAGSFLPAVDIYEDAQKLALHLEVPGIQPNQIDLRVENNTLTVKGERQFANDIKEENFHRIERRYGSFVRSLTLPQPVDTADVRANYEHGVLTIELPKKAAAQPKQIKVNVQQTAPAQPTVEAAQPTQQASEPQQA